MREQKPWQCPNNILKVDESCLKGKPHILRIMSISRTENIDNSLFDVRNRSEIIYQCKTCKKYHVDRHDFTKTKKVEQADVKE